MWSRFFSTFLTAQILFGFSNFIVFGKEFSLTILHINDVHSRFQQTNKYSVTCSKSEQDKKQCYGGFGRLLTQSNEIRKSHPNVAFLSAGDFFQGTFWYTLYKWKVVAHFVNKLRLTAMAIGNHEFDDGIDGLVPFLDAVKFPVISSNINTRNEPKIQGKFDKSIIVDYEGRKVGIIGYTTPEAKFMSNPGELIFESEIEGVTNEAKRLNKEGIKILIAVGHAGYDIDMKIAEVPFIDVVVGGHSNSFLYSGKIPPDMEIPLGKYPTVITQSNGRKVSVVQAFAYTKYLGYLNLTFDNEGEVTSWAGHPILLNNEVPEDPEIKTELEEWGKNISNLIKGKVGKTRVLLEGRSEVCRLKECNMGNVIGKAMLHTTLKMTDETKDGWADVSMAILNSGGIRGSLDETSANGTITMEDIMTIMPFQNTIDVIQIRGKYLREAFEFSVMGYDPKGIHISGRFLQMSGIRVTYDISQPDGKRVKKLHVLCSKCRVPEFIPINSTEVYKVAIPTFLANGGDGYEVIKKNLIVHHKSGILDSDVMVEYFRERSPIIMGLTGRIKFAGSDVDKTEEQTKKSSTKRQGKGI